MGTPRRAVKKGSPAYGTCLTTRFQPEARIPRSELPRLRCAADAGLCLRRPHALHPLGSSWRCRMRMRER